MSHSKDKITFDEVIEQVKTYITSEQEIKNIEKAYQLAFTKHDGQYRKSGEPYIIHPLNVAKILTTVYADSTTIQAGLLHDVLEDCDCTNEEMESIVGSEVTKLVEGVTKLSKLHFSTENEYLIEYYKKIIVGMSEDVRVIIIKLADRLHNMRTLWALPEEKRVKKANESLEILAPIAHHLGIHKVKSELEDLALRYLKPEVFYDIAERLNKTKLERDWTVHQMMEEVKDLLTEHNITFEMKGRSKSIYSIYNKLDKGKKFGEIYDLLAMRILVHTKQECYLALGLIHSKYRPMPKRFKDYIAMPKPNMYQSLHTTVFGIDGYLFEIQIRTYEMDELAENGVAAHWAYKEKENTKANLQSSTEQKLQFFKSIIDLSNDKMSSEDFVNSIKEEVLNNNIYCFTPKGDVFELPKGATPLDFAYKIHTQVGETTVGALVNNTIAPLDYELHNNDIVKIITNKSSKPSKEWINMVKSTAVKNKIRSYFSRNEKDIYIERGKESLEKELRKRKFSITEFFNQENTEKLIKEFKVENINELYLNVGNGKHSPKTVINIIHKLEEDQQPKKMPHQIEQDLDTDIIVSGIDKVKVNIANCCNPVYGDDIIGYITKGNGISIHRVVCHNLSTLDDRIVEVKWNKKSNTKKYLTIILVYCKDNENYMADIIQKTSMIGISVDYIKNVTGSNHSIYQANCYVSSKEKLDKLFLELNKQNYIDKVERIMR